MKKQIVLLAAVAMCLTGCWTRIWTVAPTTEYVTPVKTVYTTTVTTPSPKTTTVTTFTVTNYNTDMSFYLDLNAVAAAFAESRSVQEFEQILNSSRYMINNLDLNHDGWIDYLRVIETHKGVYHTLLIQACLAPSVYQDVATLIAEHRPNALYVEVIGDRWLYGSNYIVRPVFVKRPPMWDVYGRPNYNPWSSPYYYGYWPNYYQKPKPIYLNHYQAYVNTYMNNHHYCHHCDYPQQPFYNGYSQMTQPYSHNDYAQQHPNDSFERRVTTTIHASTPSVTVNNAGQLRTAVAKEAESSTPKTTQTTPATTTSTRQTTQTTPATTTSRTGTTTTTRTSTTTTVQPQTRQPSTSVDTRVNKSGETRTTIKTTDETGRTTKTTRTSSTSSATPTKSSRDTTVESTLRSDRRER